MIGVLPQGFPLPTLPGVPVADIPLLFAAALGISLVAIGDTISTSGGFARRGGYEVDGNQELAGIGSANLAAGLFSGFPVSTSGSRTAVAAQSGAKTQLTGLVAAALVLADAPRSCPASSRRCPSRSWRRSSSRRRSACSTSPSCAGCSGVRKTEFALAIACALGVAFIGVLQGIVVAVVLSVFYIFKRAWSPYSAVLGKAPDVPGYHDIRRYPGCAAGAWPAHPSLVGAPLLRQRQPVS